VSRAEVEKALKENPVAIYIHYNHGSEDAHWGSEDEAVVNLENVELLSGRETYCMNCLSAKKLGVEAWKGKATAYWGYIEVFTFTTEAPDEFREFANSGLKFWLEGKTWKESLQLAKDLAKALTQKLVEAGKYIASVVLQGDADALRCYTEDMPPTSDCAFRRLSIRLFGPKIGWKLGKKHIVISFAAVASIFAYALGFNTLDWMVFSLNPPENWYFIYPNKLGMPFWWAYFLGGILPLSIGAFLAGLIVGMVTHLKLLKKKSG